jgi:microcystin-dependent protein
MDAYLGEIRTFAGNFTPVGWLPCDGRLLPISEYEALYTLLGTIYGGDGVSTFGLPDLQGRAPMHRKQGSYPVGAKAGDEAVTLTLPQLPVHTHAALATNLAGTVDVPTNGLWASPLPDGDPPPPAPKVYSSTTDGTMNPLAVQAQGGSQPHDNMMPFLAVTFIIASQGLFPQQA